MGGAQLADGSTPRIGPFEVRGHLHTEDAAGSSTATLSAPFEQLHQMHDVVKQGIAFRQQQAAQHDPSAPFVPLIQDARSPRANMLLFQVCIISSSSAYTLLLVPNGDCTASCAALLVYGNAASEIRACTVSSTQSAARQVHERKSLILGESQGAILTRGNLRAHCNSFGHRRATAASRRCEAPGNRTGALRCPVRPR